MTKYRACANAPALPDVPCSQRNPYHLAIYTHQLIKAASQLVDAFEGPNPADNGISGLLSVIEERMRILSYMLDAAAFCEKWPELAVELDRDPSLGMWDRERAA